MPKRKGYILEQIADWDNLELAVCNSQKAWESVLLPIAQENWSSYAS